MKTRITTMLGAALILVATMAFSASAAIIPSFDYTVDGAFVEWDTTVGTTGTVLAPATGITGSDPVSLNWGFPMPGGTQDGYHKLSWGDVYDGTNGTTLGAAIPDANMSSLFITAGTGTMTTNGPTEDGMTLFHDNQTINSDSIQVVSGKVRATLTLTPVGYPTFPAFSTVLEFAFYETLNSSATPNDVFVLLNPEAMVEDFKIGNQWYTVSFEGNFDTISPAYQQVLINDGVDPLLAANAVGWVTNEGQLNERLTNIRIVATPEPSTMLLLGLGFGLLGFAGYRRSRS
ncbi:THxN family PEP-CTERM protein [Oleidesulfovibrio sp.]|uniref:THxN family PEP-CTERM protein n=1 Tax=Oleidesulfovibrio sp. TaxID=2909707 RepID=UPI003A896EA6